MGRTTICIIVVVFLGLVTLTIWSQLEEDCKIKVHILKGVNGMTDENDGLLSGGDAERTSLLMEDGTIISVSYRIKKLKIGQVMQIKECTFKGGGTSYSIVT